VDRCEAIDTVYIYKLVKRDVELSLMWTDARQLILYIYIQTGVSDIPKSIYLLCSCINGYDVP
jgi:hypothetical protein